MFWVQLRYYDTLVFFNFGMLTVLLRCESFINAIFVNMNIAFIFIYPTYYNLDLIFCIRLLALIESLQ